MSDTVERWDCSDLGSGAFMESCEDGDWVYFEDYAALAAERDALKARVAAADALADQAQMVKDFRYDPNIGVQLNFLEEALAAYQATKEQSK